jgi:hypothetical protein
MITVVSSATVFGTARAALHLAPGNNADPAYWIASLRRLAGYHCPCSPRTLIASIVESHRNLVVIDETFIEQLEGLIEVLVAAGDLLELSDVTTLDETVKATWLFAAPPTFVVHPSGAAFLIGLASDDPLPLPAELLERVATRRAIRTIAPLVGEDLPLLLEGIGFRQLSLESWLKHPKKEDAATHLGSMDARLGHRSQATDTTDMRILDWTLETRRYRDRWRAPLRQTGSFLLRRPQAYGADLWSYGRFNVGQLEALIDFPLPGGRWRGCDIAWRVQLAIDALAGRPQRYRKQLRDEFAHFDFFFPLPSWARRRLGVVGEELSPEGCLMSFRVPVSEAQAEQAFLRDYLYFESDE